jgi:hypothetical protein
VCVGWQDKVPAEDVELIKADIEAVKKAKDDDAVGVEELKEKIEALKKSSMKIGARRARRACDAARSGWWLVAGGWWLVAGGWWLVVRASTTALSLYRVHGRRGHVQERRRRRRWGECTV